MVYIGLRVEGCREYITGLWRVQGVGFRGTRIIYIYMYIFVWRMRRNVGLCCSVKTGVVFTRF